MSLKAFHLLFVAASIALSALFALWSVNEYASGGPGVNAAFAAAGLLAAVGLSFYAVRIARKLKHVSLI